MIAISIACGLVICLFQLDVGGYWSGLIPPLNPRSNANSNRGRLGTEPVGVSRIALFLPQAIWRRVVKLFRRAHDPFLAASLTAFNDPRIYLSSDFSPPLHLILSRL